MEIRHLDGSTTNTNELADIDALLMEESKKLHELFAKYNRPMVLIGEMKPFTNTRGGCVFFHFATEDSTLEQQQENFDKCIRNVDGFIRSITQNKLCITAIHPPSSPPVE